MPIYLKTITREKETLTNEIEHIRKGFPKENNQEYDNDNENGYRTFTKYHDLRMKLFELEAEQSNYFFIKTATRGRHKQQRKRRRQRRRNNSCSNSDSIVGREFLAPTINNEAQINLTEDEHQLIKHGPRFIFDDPKISSPSTNNRIDCIKT